LEPQQFKDIHERIFTKDIKGSANATLYRSTDSSASAAPIFVGLSLNHTPQRGNGYILIHNVAVSMINEDSTTGANNMGESAPNGDGNVVFNQSDARSKKNAEAKSDKDVVSLIKDNFVRNRVFTSSKSISRSKTRNKNHAAESIINEISTITANKDGEVVQRQDGCVTSNRSVATSFMNAATRSARA
jgi:hypothetical protein